MVDDNKTLDKDKKDKDVDPDADPDVDPDADPDADVKDDPLGIGLDSTTTYGGIGCCVCLILLCIIGLIFWIRSGSSSSEGTDSECCPTPSHYTVEFKYADGVNPYNNFSIPPFLPKPPQYFGTPSE